MKLADKIIGLRKSNGFSQEELAEKLNVSRQAISRWEMGTAMPDASNIKQISKLFGVTADYLLNDDYQSDNDLPKVKETKQNSSKQIIFYLVIIEVMTILIQFMSTVVMESVFFAALSFIPFLAIVGGFEYGYRKSGNEKSAVYRNLFYKISVWLGMYFPTRFLATIVIQIFPQLFSGIIFEIVVIILYITFSTVATLSIDAKTK